MKEDQIDPTHSHPPSTPPEKPILIKVRVFTEANKKFFLEGSSLTLSEKTLSSKDFTDNLRDILYDNNCNCNS